MIKVFKKRGSPNYKDQRLINEIEAALEKLAAKNPGFLTDFQPATNSEELKALYNKYCIEDAKIISETKHTDMAQTKKEEHVLSDEKDVNLKETRSTVEGNGEVKFDNQEEVQADPFNRANPKVRDYVLNDVMSPEGTPHEVGSTKTIDEPLNHEQAFKLPEGDPKEEKKKDGPFSENKETKKKQDNYVNPNFGEMATATRNKKTKRMATYIVGAFCVILKEGVPILLTRDITPAALAKAAKDREIDLSILLQLDEETQMSVAEFFSYMCKKAKSIGIIGEEQKQNLTEDLYDLLLEKGVTPTPMQSIMLGLLEVTAMVGLKAMAFRSEIKQVKEIAVPMSQDERAAEAQALTDRLNKEEEAATPGKNKTEDVEYEEEEEEQGPPDDDDTPDLDKKEEEETGRSLVKA